MSAEGTKVCSSCDQEKPLSSFLHNARTEDYYVGTCKACRLKEKVIKYAWPITTNEGVMMNASNSMKLGTEQATFELTLLNAELVKAKFDDVVVSGIKLGIAPELLTRLEELWEQTKVVAGEVIAIGKIIVRKVIDFLLANPKLTIGLAIGAAISVLIAGIPFIGPILAPIALLISTLYGAGVGASMQKGDYSGSPFTAAIELAHKFFELIAIIFNAVAQYWKA
jgi:hypothetical protein